MLKDNNPVAVAFRVDASLTIGAGHVMRCLTLANSLREYGVKSFFICRAHPEHMAEKINAEGHKVLLLPVLHIAEMKIGQCAQGKYASWLGATLIEDANETIQHLKNIKPKWMIIDHFAVSSDWEHKVKKEINLKIMVIDGLANRKHECDLLLDQTYSVQGEERWKNLIPKECKLLVGPKHAIFRPEFIEAHRHLRRRNGKVKRILIAFGGVDVPNATSITLDALCELNNEEVTIDVIIGLANPHRKNLIKKYSNIENVCIYVNPANIAELMTAADLAIGGGGTMMWERCLLKLPTLIISIAENQVQLAKSLHSINAAVYIGDITVTTSKSIKDSINKLINNEEQIIEIQNACETLMSQDNFSISKYLLENTK